MPPRRRLGARTPAPGRDPPVGVDRRVQLRRTARCQKLGLEYAVAREEKLAVLKEWLARNGIPPTEAVYVGNDEPDSECMLYVGCGVAPTDAYSTAKASARIVLDAEGAEAAFVSLPNSS